MEKMVLPPQVSEAISRLEDGGYEAFLVGGAVRDYVMGIDGNTDWDITTNALPEQIESVFVKYRVIETGIKHGTVTVIIDAMPLEITTYRIDGEYSDHRRPDEVSFTSSLREDMKRRDFTINAMAYNPKLGIIDYFGGKDDISAGIIRCIGSPEGRFQEDSLRILRGLRFSSVFKMAVDPNTSRAMHRNRELLSLTAGERIRSEFTKLLCGENVKGVLLEYADVICVFIPEIEAMIGFEQHSPYHDRDVWQHTAAVTESVPKDPILRWAALLHDIGKPQCFSMSAEGIGHFYGHGEKSVQLAENIMDRLHFDNHSRRQITELIRYHDIPIAPTSGSIKRLMNRLGAEAAGRLISLHRGDTMGQSALCADRIRQYDCAAGLLEQLVRENSCFSLKDLAVDGNDMMSLGLRGREIGAALEMCLNLVIDDKAANDREVLMDHIRRQL